MAYATASQFKARYDARQLGQLASDTGVPVPPAELENSAAIAAVLEDASGEIDAALLQGNRYTTTQLASLSGNSASHLVRLCCKIAWGLLWERRSYADDGRRDEAMESARRELNRLKNGEHVFDVDEVQDAGNPEASIPSRVDYQRMNLIVDEARGRFYPRRRITGE